MENETADNGATELLNTSAAHAESFGPVSSGTGVNYRAPAKPSEGEAPGGHSPVRP